MRTGADDDGKSDAAEDANQIGERGPNAGPLQAAPAQRIPKRRAVVDANQDEKEEENYDGPGGLETDGDGSVGFEHVDELIGGEVIAREEGKREDDFHDKKAADGESEKDQEFAKAPRCADVFGGVCFLGRRRRDGKLRDSG